MNFLNEIFSERRPVKRFLIVLFLAFFAIFTFIPTSLLNSQKREKNSKIEILNGRDEPVKIISFDVKDVALESGQEFVSDDEWLKDLRLNFENLSGKTVTYISVGLLFPRTEKEKTPLNYSIKLGRKGVSSEQENSIFEIKPDSEKNKTSTFLLQDYEGIRFYLNKLDYPSRIMQIQVYIEEIGFSDGMIWSLGVWYKIDPKNPKKFIRIEDKDTKDTVFLNLKMIV